MLERRSCGRGEAQGYTDREGICIGHSHSTKLQCLSNRAFVIAFLRTLCQDLVSRTDICWCYTDIQSRGDDRFCSSGHKCSALFLCCSGGRQRGHQSFLSDIGNSCGGWNSEQSQCIQRVRAAPWRQGWSQDVGDNALSIYHIVTSLWMLVWSDIVSEGPQTLKFIRKEAME